MRDLEDVFKATAASVQGTFQAEMGVASFRIPEYQRQYSWDQENISRLLDDIYEGLISLGRTDDSLAFIGTMILVEEGASRESSFNGRSLVVVDGQQRITTLAIICCLLLDAMRQERKRSEEWADDKIKSFVLEESKIACDELFGCVVGRPGGPRISSVFDYFPRVVREETDTRAATAAEAKYHSLIADFIFQYCDHVYEDRQAEFEFKPKFEGDDYPAFKTRLKIVSDYISVVSDGGDDETSTFPKLADLVSNERYRRALFPKLQQREDRIADAVRDAKKASDSHDTLKLIRLTAFANFLLYRVAITRVTADDDEYAFDIFEALNTTGEPLTALETFKPAVIQFENSLATKYKDSPSQGAITQIEQHIRSLGSYDAQQRETREIVVLAALFVNGRKEAYHLSSQRKYLRNTFNESKKVDGKRRFVQSIADVAEYRRRFWTKDGLPNQLRDHQDKEVALCCLSFLRDLGNSLTIPILMRYWLFSRRSGNSDVFVDAIKAVTAFVVLRRASTGGTKGIDSDYRDVMRQGGRKKADGDKPLMLGVGKDENELPDVVQLRKYLVSYLGNPKLGITTKSDWLKKVSQQPLYPPAGPGSLVRFVMLCVAHNSVQDNSNPFLLKKDKPHPGRDYLNLNRWRAQELETIEHIAPQSKNSGWNEDLYNDLNLIHCLGNLTLLPEKHNSTIGNSAWKHKKLFYEAAAADTKAAVENCIKKAGAIGINFGPKAEEMFLNRQTLPILSTVAAAANWDADIVRQRSENIGDLLWEEIAPWLDIS